MIYPKYSEILSTGTVNLSEELDRLKKDAINSILTKVELVCKAALAVGITPRVKCQSGFLLDSKVLVRYTIICGEAIEVLDLTL